MSDIPVIRYNKREVVIRWFVVGVPEERDLPGLIKSIQQAILANS